MNTSIIQQARRFMTGDELLLGGEECVSCGLPRANTPISKTMNNTFNCFGLFLNESTLICPQCMDMFKDKAGRTKFLLYTDIGKQRIIEREDVLTFIKEPPSDRYVLSVPYSFQKHHWIHAGLSTQDMAYIGTDAGTIAIDYARHDIPYLVDTAIDAVMCGLSRKELVAGKYSVFTRSRFGTTLSAWDTALAPLRHGGVLDLIVRHIPAVKTKKSFTIKEDAGMFSDTEQKAIAIISTLANASRYRREQGLAFWQSFFKRRIMRNVDYPLNQFFSGVARGVFCEASALDVSLIEDMGEDDARAVMKEIKQKTDLLIAAAYTAMKEASPGSESRKEPSAPKSAKKEKEHGQASFF